jgi:hypothetical protein
MAKRNGSLLSRGTLSLTLELWALIELEAQAKHCSEAHVVREILGRHFRLAQALYNPPRKKAAGTCTVPVGRAES